LRQYNVEPPGLPLENTSTQAVSQPCYSNSSGSHYKADEHMPGDSLCTVQVKKIKTVANLDESCPWQLSLEAV
jgi:hypothetical protein